MMLALLAGLLVSVAWLALRPRRAPPDPAGRGYADLARVEALRDTFRAVGERWRIDPAVLAGIASRETGVKPIDGDPYKDTTGAVIPGQFHGRGMMQIDDRSHATWIAAWEAGGRDLAANIDYGAEVLRNAWRSVAPLYRVQTEARITIDDPATRAALAAYNAGPRRVREAIIQRRNPDSVTHGGDYSADVISRARTFRGTFA